MLFSKERLSLFMGQDKWVRQHCVTLLPKTMNMSCISMAMIPIPNSYLSIKVSQIINKSISDYQSLFSGYQIVCIDEAQMVTNIGSVLKLIVDHLPNVQLIVTGSSSFDLANQVNEPLTGRAYIFHLYPLSVSEIISTIWTIGFDQQLHQRLVFGMYPEAVAHNHEKTLITLSEHYIYKDVLMVDMIKRSDSIIKLLQALAYQIGNKVSYLELWQIVWLDSRTIQKYIHILEQAFIIFRLPSFSKNLRNELKKSHKIYFWDNGVRNSLIRRFTPVDQRDDVWSLRENFIISEIKKKDAYNNILSLSYFRRTKQQQEIDYITIYNDILTAYECKRNSNKHFKRPESFMNSYQASYHIINRDNYLNYLQ